MFYNPDIIPLGLAVVIETDVSAVRRRHPLNHVCGDATAVTGRLQQRQRSRRRVSNMALNRNHSQNGGVLINNGETYVFRVACVWLVLLTSELSPLFSVCLPLTSQCVVNVISCMLMIAGLPNISITLQLTRLLTLVLAVALSQGKSNTVLLFEPVQYHQ